MAIAIAAIVIYFVARQVVYSQLDDSLRQRVDNTSVSVTAEVSPGLS